jgi:hypothetical protein
MDSSQPPGAQNPHKAETRLVTAGRDTKAQKGFVNPPVFHGSTVLYPTAGDLHAHRSEFQYGRHGTPTTRALQDVLMALEGSQCAGVGLAPSGLAAISTTLLAVAKAGDHLLVCDNAYRPTRNFCNGILARYGVETTYFDPLVGSGIEELFKPNTRAVLVEARHSRHRGRGACARRAGHRRQHLGDTAVSSFARAWRRYQHAGRHQIYRRPFRHHVRHHLGQRQSLADHRGKHPPARRLRRP